jgi:hypothetical protein
MRSDLVDMLWPFQPATGMGGDQYLRYLQIRLVLPDFVVRLSTLAGTQSQAQTKWWQPMEDACLCPKSNHFVRAIYQLWKMRKEYRL